MMATERTYERSNGAAKTGPRVLPPLSSKKKRVDTIILDRGALKILKRPAFQREVKVNTKVRELAEEIAQTGVFPGILTVGLFDAKQWVIDGQHRIEAYLLSEREEVYADVHYYECASLREMAEIYTELNQSLVRFGPDDILRAAEEGSAALKLIRQKCPFVGYGQVRRGESSPLLSMSATLRCWHASLAEVPSSSGLRAADLATSLTVDSAERLCQFLVMGVKAWGRDAQYVRLWGALNLSLCMWLFNRTVFSEKRTARTTQITAEQFRVGLMALSANSVYLDYLVGRQLNDDHRSAAYDRIKTLIVRRLQPEIEKKLIMPQPAWASGHSASRAKNFL